MYVCIIPKPPYLLKSRATISGPAANPILTGTGNDGIKMGIEPTKIPKISPPNMEKKSGSSSFFSEFPTTCSACSRAYLLPTITSLSPKNNSNEPAARNSIPDRKTRVTFKS